MSKYMTYGRRPPTKPRPWKVHPIWRGIGCVMIVLIPLMSYAGAVLLIQADMDRGWIPLPVEFVRPVRLPYLDVVVPHFLATVVVTILLMLVGFAVIMVFYATMYRFMGPSALGPLDAPPERRTRKRT